MIEATDLTKAYGGRLAVDNLSFSVRPGQVTGFLGPNGAGKSTTMRLMVGLDNGGGRTTFDGKPFRDLREPLREVGVLLEAKNFHPTRTARNHLRMLAASARIPNRRVDEVLELVGLATVASKHPKGFSLGMGQRLGLAAALLGEPRVLILDEPANGLDPQGISWLRGLLRNYAASGRTVLVSSHLLAEMAHTADHLVVIGRGRLISDSPTSEFTARARTTVMVRTPQADELTQALQGSGATVVRTGPDALSVTGMDQPRVGEAAFAAGVVLHELATNVASLEEAFLEATSGAQEHGARVGSVPPENPRPAGLGTPGQETT